MNKPIELWKNLKVIGLGRASEQADIPIPLDRLNEHFVKDPTLNNTTKQDTVLPDSAPPTRDKFYFTDVTPIDFLNHFNFPKIWKQAFVLPLPKVKVPTDPNDYRPISILPAISKALERIVHRQITNYMNEHKLFDKYQSGFRAGHNTSTALLKVTEDIREAIDSNKVTILTLLDLSKAFNSVNFDLLTHKLRNLHLSETAVSWFESYLRERQQCVVSGNRSSSWFNITSGIPQGSVLGPLLFTIYVSDITSHVKHCNYHLYADDLQCYISSRLDRINDAIDKLNKDIDSIVTWTKKFHLNINPGKTQAIILGHKRQTDAVKHLDISPVKIEEQLEEEQFGFRKGKGTRDAIGLLRTIGERYLEKNKEVRVVFVDLENAYKDGRPYPWPGEVSGFILYPESANQTIYSKSVVESDSGNYSCLVRNDTHELRHTINVTVMDRRIQKKYVYVFIHTANGFLDSRLDDKSFSTE
ncbi:hypothetical protein ANN_25817 [Periplaneta americana]|uniref:Reverse transcriptase domain-containing protein n=1 Tax=Periplaneta americana TaxID=6978 RepID=A0ABQ8S4L5_PERAM|nr:hypothetical protein ANN_25817 [Periplaneta americana]